MSRLRVLLLFCFAVAVVTADVEFTHHNNTMMASVLQQVEGVCAVASAGPPNNDSSD
jgi:hypothetical protein